MKKLYVWFTVMVVIIGMTACDNEQPTTETAAFDMENARKVIRQKVEDFMLAFKAKDSLALASFYAADGLVLPPHSGPVTMEQNAAMWGSVFRLGLSALKLDIADISGDAAHLVESGHFEMYLGDQQVDFGNYLVVWKKEGDEWKMFRDIWNSGQPPGK